MSVEEAMSFRREGWIVEEKFDGIRAIVNLLNEPLATGRIFRAGRMQPLRTQTVAQGWHAHLAGCVFDGELLPDGTFHVFDLLALDGQDLRPLPLLERKQLLNSLADFLPGHTRLVRSFPSVAELGEFDEGLIWKRLGASYGHDWFKAKRQITVDAEVIRVWPNGVAEIAGRGKVVDMPAGVKPGDFIECVAFKVFPSGALRNGRFVRLRPDKIASMIPGCAPHNLH